jgi:hypothetical protein
MGARMVIPFSPLLTYGKALTAVFDEPHWDPERAGEGDQANYVEVRFESLLDPDRTAPLAVTDLTDDRLAAVNWSPMASGIRIPVEIALSLCMSRGTLARCSVAFSSIQAANSTGGHDCPSRRGSPRKGGIPVFTMSVGVAVAIANGFVCQAVGADVIDFDDIDTGGRLRQKCRA